MDKVLKIGGAILGAAAVAIAGTIFGKKCYDAKKSNKNSEVVEETKSEVK